MKITTGICQGMKLSTAKGQSTRPTSEKIRQAVLNSLQHDIPGCIFYDIFAGSGAMGLEAISRGAKGGFFVESAREASKCLLSNSEELTRRFHTQNLDDPVVKIVSQDAVQYISQAQKGFFPLADIIWADPPYDQSIEMLLTLSPMLYLLSSPEALLVWEMASLSSDKDIPELSGWGLKKYKKYGSTFVCTWIKREVNNE